MKLLTTRVADSVSPVPGNTTTHRCAECAARVNVSPASQKQLDANPEIEIICMRCFTPLEDDVGIVTPETAAEFTRYLREKDSH